LKSYIQTIGAWAPEKVVPNHEIAKLVDTSDEWIFTHTGIRNRHIAKDSESASDLGFNAANVALQRANASGDAVDLDSINLVLCATSTPDYPSFPSTASIIQDRLGLKNAGAMDIIAACTGFIYGIETAKAYIESGMAESVLVIGSEIFSRIINWKDRGTCVLFGDGAGAAVVSKKTGSGSSVLGRGYLRSKGNGAEHLLRPAGGSRTPFIPGSTPEEDLCVKMNGRQVYIFAVQAIIDSVQQTCLLNGVTIDEIDWIIPHQANRRIIEAACERSGWDIGKVCTNMDEYANTSAASIPLVASEMLDKGLLQRGQKVITVGFGGGLTYGGNYFVY